MKRFLLLSVLLMSGCLTVPPADVFVQGNVPADVYSKDKAACELEALKGQSNYNTGGAIGQYNMQVSYQNIYSACMRSKGYVRQNVQ